MRVADIHARIEKLRKTAGHVYGARRARMPLVAKKLTSEALQQVPAVCEDAAALVRLIEQAVREGSVECLRAAVGP